MLHNLLYELKEKHFSIIILCYLNQGGAPPTQAIGLDKEEANYKHVAFQPETSHHEVRIIIMKNKKKFHFLLFH